MASVQSVVETSRVRCSDQLPPIAVRVAASADLPSEFGTFKLHVFSNDRDSREHLAIVRGEIAGASSGARATILS